MKHFRDSPDNRASVLAMASPAGAAISVDLKKAWLGTKCYIKQRFCRYDAVERNLMEIQRTYPKKPLRFLIKRQRR